MQARVMCAARPATPLRVAGAGEGGRDGRQSAAAPAPPAGVFPEVEALRHCGSRCDSRAAPRKGTAGVPRGHSRVRAGGCSLWIGARACPL